MKYLSLFGQEYRNKNTNTKCLQNKSTKREHVKQRRQGQLESRITRQSMTLKRFTGIFSSGKSCKQRMHKKYISASENTKSHTKTFMVWNFNKINCDYCSSA